MNDGFDPTVISALAALLGSIIGIVGAFGSAWLNDFLRNRREKRQQESMDRSLLSHLMSEIIHNELLLEEVDSQLNKYKSQQITRLAVPLLRTEALKMVVSRVPLDSSNYKLGAERAAAQITIERLNSKIEAINQFHSPDSGTKEEIVQEFIHPALAMLPIIRSHLSGLLSGLAL